MIHTVKIHPYLSPNALFLKTHPVYYYSAAVMEEINLCPAAQQAEENVQEGTWE